MVPQPVVAVVMLFPIKPESEEFARTEKENIEKNGQFVSPNVYYMKQTVGNACGTVGILHAIGNARTQLSIKPNSYLDRLYKRTGALSPEAIATDLEADTEIEETHTSAAEGGQSEQQEGEVDTHFVCFR
jgi:ubiquitin carboxyl-terminal hydrolase L3